MEQHFLSIIGFDYIIQFFLKNSTFVLRIFKKIENSLVQIKFYATKTFPSEQKSIMLKNLLNNTDNVSTFLSVSLNATSLHRIQVDI